MDYVKQIIEESKQKPYGIIYFVLNKINGKCYVGQTTQEGDKRWRGHIYDSKRSRYRLLYFHKAIRKYGENNFEFRILLTVYSKEDLDAAETYYIEFFQSMNPKIGYNGKTGGANGVPNETTRRKMAEAKLGVPRPTFTQEHLNNMSKSKKGRVFTEKWKKALSLSHKGKTLSSKTKSLITQGLLEASSKKEKDFEINGKGIPSPKAVTNDYLMGMSTVDISRKYGISKSTVRNKLKRVETPIRSSSLSRNITENIKREKESDFIKKLVEEYLSGVSLRDLSTKHGISRTTVKSRIEGFGVKIRTKKESWSNQYNH